MGKRQANAALESVGRGGHFLRNAAAGIHAVVVTREEFERQTNLLCLGKRLGLGTLTQVVLENGSARPNRTNPTKPPSNQPKMWHMPPPAAAVDFDERGFRIRRGFCVRGGHIPDANQIFVTE